MGKKIFLLQFICVLNICSLQAQSYEDIYRQIDNLPPKTVYEYLFRFQQKNPKMTNLYLQAGYICERIAHDIDPFRDNERFVYWYNNAKLFYGIFPEYNDFDINVHRKYYRNLPISFEGDKANNEDVLAFQKMHVAVCVAKIDSTQMAFGALRQAKSFYDKSIGQFNQLNKKYFNRKKALLCADLRLLEELENIAVNADSCLFYFQKYKKITQAYPIAGYDQNLIKKEIETFRLDGLTNSDFLQPDFYVWDFRKWVEEFKQEYANNIIPLRKEAEDLQLAYSVEFLRIGKSDSIVSLEPLLDERFLYRLGRYDHNSLLRTLFLYLDAKRNFMNYTSGSLGRAEDFSEDLFPQKMRYYYQLYQLQEEAFDALQKLDEQITMEKVESFATFFDASYKGFNGLKQFTKQEKQLLQAKGNNLLDNLHTYYQNRKSNDSIIVYKGKKICPIDALQEQDCQYYALQKDVERQNGKIYIWGTTNRKEDAFVACSVQSKIKWLKELHNVTAQNNFICSTDEGCLLLMQQNGKWSLQLFDDNGKCQEKHVMNSEGTPCYLHYDDLRQQALVCFKPDTVSRLNLAFIDLQGETGWHNSIEGIVGYPQFIISNQEGSILFICDSTQPNGNKVLKVSRDGQRSMVTTIASETTLDIKEIFPIASNCIGILAYKPDNSIVFQIINNNGNVQLSR